MNFRKEINGLRAFAVIAVVIFHFNASWMPGGFAGVDVFFVISGFLMTGIIFKGLENNNFSVLNFYVARANRIIPALAALCLVLLIFGWFYLTPLKYKALGKHVASSLGFLSNIIYFKEAGYFEASSHEKWLLHTWSLSVEWQFYIIYPLVLLSLKRVLNVKVLKSLIIIATVIGFIFSVYSTHKWPSASYYLFPMRAWEMMLGGIAFLYPLKLEQSNKWFMELCGLFLIIGSYIFITGDDSWPGYLALFPVMGTFLVVQAQNNESIITGNIIFQKLGAWSYSIYLWHWPFVVAIYTYSLPKQFIYIGLALSVLLGYLSYKYIERIKFPKSFPTVLGYFKCKPIYIAGIGGVLGYICFITEGANLDFRPAANSEKDKFLNYYAQEHKNLDEAYWLKCNTYTSLSEKGSLDTDPVCITKSGEGGIFLWGDSHAEALSLGLRTYLERKKIPFYQKTSAGCKPSLENTDTQNGVFKEACDYSNQLALKSIKLINPQYIVIAQSNSHEKTDWLKISSYISSISNAKVIIVGPVPQWKPSLPQVMVKSQHWKKSEIMISDSGLDLDIIKTDKLMKQNYGKIADLTYISLIDDLCNTNRTPYSCRVKTDNDDLLQIDYGHLSQEGSIYIVNRYLIKYL